MEEPVIILDETHKAAGRNFGVWAGFVNRLGPRLVIELSATPIESKSNMLRVVTGRDLWDEEMIKKHILVNTNELNWRGALKQAVDRLKDLEELARKYRRYIRPIMVIRVKYVDPKLHSVKNDGVHAFDARDYLSHTLDIPSEQVVIKTSKTDDLKG